MKDDAIAHQSDQLVAILQDYKNLKEGNKNRINRVIDINSYEGANTFNQGFYIIKKSHDYSNN